MTATMIHHVQVAMPQDREDEARYFYGDLLGFPELEKPENLRKRGGVWFETGNLQLHLGVDNVFVPATKAHIAYLVDDLDALRSRFITAGIVVNDDEPLPGFHRFYVDDPFGNRVELLEPVS